MNITNSIYPLRKTSLPVFLFCLLLLSLTASVKAQTTQTTQTTTVDPVPVDGGGQVIAAPSPTPVPGTTCARVIKADVVALDQVIMFNRLGTVNPSGMIYALKQDVVAIDPAKGLVAGNVRLRSDKRPRPIVLRMNSGDCLKITFTNLLSPTPLSHKDPEDPLSDQPATRTAGIHVIGMELVNGIASDGSNVGVNPPSLVGPGGTAIYTYTATRE